MRGADIVLEPDLPPVDPVAPMFPGLIELVFNFAFEPGGAFEQIVESRRHRPSMTDTCSVREVDLAFRLQPIAQTAFGAAAPSLVNLRRSPGDAIET